MSNSLQGKVALVTGGSRGLGALTARSLADAGAHVAITYVASADKAAEVVKELEDKGVQAAAFQSDQAHAALAPQLIDDVVARFGGLDIVVNNAAIGVESGKTIDDPSINTAELDRMHATNYTGVIAIIRAAEGPAGQRPDHQHRFGHRHPRRHTRLHRLRRHKGRPDRLHQGSGTRLGAARHHRQHGAGRTHVDLFGAAEPGDP
jgi:NAD(P)-dependent dehydrogenase (short-subunit alcohol dehydrogenase family)